MVEQDGIGRASSSLPFSSRNDRFPMVPIVIQPQRREDGAAAAAANRPRR